MCVELRLRIENSRKFWAHHCIHVGMPFSANLCTYWAVAVFVVVGVGGTVGGMTVVGGLAVGGWVEVGVVTPVLTLVGDLLVQ